MLRITLTTLLTMTVVIAGCKASINTSKDQVPGWSVGGTLHDTPLPRWAGGRDEDKLATAGEVLYEALWQGHLQSEEQLVAFRGQSEKAVRMMDDFSRLYPRMVQANRSVAGWTVRSFIQGGLKDGEDFDRLMGPASLESTVETPSVDGKH